MNLSDYDKEIVGKKPLYGDMYDEWTLNKVFIEGSNASKFQTICK